MSARLTHRTQILLDDERHERLERAAADSGRSIASIIREAIDEKLRLGEEDERRRAAARALLDAPLPGGREPDWEQVKQEMADELYRRYCSDKQA